MIFFITSGPEYLGYTWYDKDKKAAYNFTFLFFNWAWQQGIMGYMCMTMAVMETCLKGDN